MGELERRLAEIERVAEKGVALPGVRVATSREIEAAAIRRGAAPRVTGGSALEAAMQRVFAAKPPAELERALRELAGARESARKTWENVRRYRQVDARGQAILAGRSGAVLAPGAGEAAKKFAKAGGAAAVQPVALPVRPHGGGVQILFDWLRRLPHTYTTKKGKHCLTDKWISDGFLVYFAEYDPDSTGGINDPWFGIRGPKFRCYYPFTSMADWESCMTSGSSGRWLNAWPQKSVYIKF